MQVTSETNLQSSQPSQLQPYLLHLADKYARILFHYNSADNSSFNILTPRDSFHHDAKRSYTLHDRSSLTNCWMKSHPSNSALEVATDAGMRHPIRIVAAAEENGVVATNQIGVIRQMFNHIYSTSTVDGHRYLWKECVNINCFVSRQLFVRKALREARQISMSTGAAQSVNEKALKSHT